MSEFSLAKCDQGYLLRYANLADFIVSSDGNRIGLWPRSATYPETLSHLLLDKVFPRVLAHKGQLVIHAGAVRVKNTAVAFLGGTGTGKSTLTASFYSAGYPLLTDDCIVLAQNNGRVTSIPTYPSLRLWMDAIDGVFSEKPITELMAHYSNKLRVSLPAHNKTAGHPLPLAAFYLLETHKNTPKNSIAVSPVSERNAFMAIIRNSFQLDAGDRRRSAALFEAVGEVVQLVPAFSLDYPRSFSLLPKVRAAVLRHLERRESQIFSTRVR